MKSLYPTNRQKLFLLTFILIISLGNVSIAQDNAEWLDLDTVKAGKFDTGKMWTFDFPPSDYFETEYDFRPDEEWFDHVRMAALRFATYCSASFVSEDGLIMTNHHCARKSVSGITREGEDLHEDGFTAGSLEKERPVPGLFVDQLVLIEDVTDDIQNAIDDAGNEEQRLVIEAEKIVEIEEQYTQDTDLDVSVVSLYNGGKYSLYGYRRYNDVRLVFAPESQAGYFGGDPDNFTYPRYNLDCSFFRVYDTDGEPLKTDHYFKWSKKGVKQGDVVFVVGNPGSTNRLNTIAQLEYLRDISYPRTIELIEGLIETYNSMLEEQPDRELELRDRLLSFLNSLKAYTGMLKGLRDPVLMQRKKDFEYNFKSAVLSNEELNKNYGEVWGKIEDIRDELRQYTNERFALSMNRFTTPGYFFIAEELVNIAEELNLPEEKRSEIYKGEELENTLEALMPGNFDYEMSNKLLKDKIKILYKCLGSDDEVVQKITGGKTGDDAVKFMLSSSSITNLDDIKNLVEQGADAILNSDDPFIYYVLNGVPRSDKLDKKMDDLLDREDIYNQQLGRALFEVYGTSIPPDATFTLRISDGVVKGFPYNGTVAPPITTFYGLYDRYYSHNKEFPWVIHKRWLNLPPEFDLSTPFNFVSTCDVIGGASGSPVLNKNAEIVGVSFDGNIEALPGDFIFRTEENRSVAVHSDGMMEAIQDLYKNNRLAEELKNGKLPD